ncbi:MAG: tRNA lysidine(34) synthetase TilS [Burkholderiaceae bacterium]|nr:tRNA lysidine(34) synthetase TilS [Burkholderiaceae bacterium]
MTRSLAQALDSFQPGLPLAVAYSGGADSTALLWACAERWPGQIRAIHIHHGLQAAADDFEQHCRETCTRLGVPLQVLRIDARHAPGRSPEDAARSARYAALCQVAEAAHPPIRHIALAQHADDQVETLLLALSRGAGLPGLSAMPAQWERDGITYYRPLLDVNGTALRDDLRARGIAWVEDPTNADEQYTRNRIRARLLPALETVFPQFRDTFARSAAHAAQAQRLLDELAAQDLAQVGQPPQIARLRELGRDRQANLLRHWLRSVHDTAASTAQLEELLDQIAACSTRGHRIQLKVGAGHVERQGAVLAWYNP